MSEWYDKKEPYIKAFGGLTYRHEEKITIILSDAAKDRKFDSMLEMLEDEVEVGAKAENGLSFYDFLLENQEGFFDNQVVREHPEIKIKKGMKLLKCFKYFLPSFTTTRCAQDLASRFIQESKIEGYLHLSVHPMDFLAMSENNSSWRSCHSLDGDYRAGNLSYMVDGTTIVAYLASDKKESLKALPDYYPWYNKKWRMLVHTNNFRSVIYYDRQYPFDNDELQYTTFQILNAMNENAFKEPNQNGFSTIRIKGWNESLDLDHNFILGAEDCIYDTREIINEKDFLGYCDLIYSPHYTPITSIKKENEYMKLIEETCVDQKSLWDRAFHREYDIKVGGKVWCVKCGQRHIKRNDSFLCDDCIAIEDADDDYFLVCESCGSRIYDMSEATTINGELVCKVCASAINKDREGDI